MARYIIGLSVTRGICASLADAATKIYAQLPIAGILINEQPDAVIAEVASLVPIWARCPQTSTPRYQGVTPIFHHSKMMPTDLIEAIATAPIGDLPWLIELGRSRNHNPMGKLIQFTLAMDRSGITPNQVKFCLNTADVHLSDIDIGDYKVTTAFLSRMPDPAWLGLIIVTGAAVTASGSRLALPFADDDAIWGNGRDRQKNIGYEQSGCYAFVAYARKHNIPIILETRASYPQDDIIAFVKRCGWTTTLQT